MEHTLHTLRSRLIELKVKNELYWMNRRWPALKVFSKDSMNGFFWVRKSTHGWVLGDQDIYLVRDSSNIADVCAAWLSERNSHCSVSVSPGVKLEATWWNDEWSAEQEMWESVGWQKLFELENTMYCDQWEPILPIGNDFLSELSPSRSWDFSYMYDQDMIDYELHSAQLNLVSLQTLRDCLAKTEELLALDWNHDCYRLLPDASLRVGDLELWPIPVFPSGDIHAFVARDFRRGIACNPNGVITAFGDRIPQVFTTELTKSFLEPKLLSSNVS
jgi:hypothetical protein